MEYVLEYLGLNKVPNNIYVTESHLNLFNRKSSSKNQKSAFF